MAATICIEEECMKEAISFGLASTKLEGGICRYDPMVFGGTYPIHPVEIVSVRDVFEIPWADKVDMVKTKDGTQFVVERGSFRPHNCALHFKKGALVPLRDPRMWWLRPGNWGIDQMHEVKPKLLRGCISQGILLPLDDFPEVTGWGEAHFHGGDILRYWYEKLACRLGVK